MRTKGRVNDRKVWDSDREVVLNLFPTVGTRPLVAAWIFGLAGQAEILPV